MGDNRQRAIGLKAADAKTLLNTFVPFAYRIMSPAQVQQVQNVLDAAVVNPVINQEANEIYRKSVRAQSGNLVMRDEKMVARAYKHNATMIAVGEKERHIRLDYQRLLAPDALKPTTDNPDEAAYLEKVKNTLISKGVFLRVDQPYVRDPSDPSHHMKDPRVFEAWLSLGYGGDHIPTKDGRITREALLGTTVIGAGYYTAVDTGPTQKALEREIKRLESQIDDGMTEHRRLRKRKNDAPIVSGISDFVGGADLPSYSIWEHPHKLILKALEMNIGGNVSGSRPYLIMAAIITRNNAQLLSQYVDDSVSGAGSVVKVLTVAKTAGEIAEIGLTITSGVGLVRGGVRAAGSKAVRSEVDELAEKVLNEYIKKNPGIAEELDTVKWIRGPKGTTLGNIKGGHSAGYGEGFRNW